METFLESMDLWILLLLLVVGYSFGRIAEWRHYRSIRRREDTFGNLIVVASKTPPAMPVAPRTTLVMGNAVISIDYFKRFVASLRKIFGGRLRTYESLLDRARREAILRMQADAQLVGATMIFNMRFETSSISKGAKNSVGTVEVVAYGTGVIPQAGHDTAVDAASI